ncbi:hypothetical protein B0T20DRAFT_263470 [Sordaria brevicollis]|uniref:sn-1-specific diacylglycerol lipase n=1 Tax=Sordaria brevicollis TaxID=83679 RepID=A0AAE0PA52_SORBR|nr:hypothetical protein B0T20DRAFT_263470 [Sordaria brevicollis]
MDFSGLDAEDTEDYEGARLAVVPGDSITSQLHDLAPSNPGRTLLPSSVARAVSFATRSTSLALRVGTLLTGYGFDAAKMTTLSSLEMGRFVLEGILGRAGRDAIARSSSEHGRKEAENMLEKSLENLHRTMSQILFWTTTGFHVTGTTIAMFSETSQLLLSTLDQFFGSTDSSRAMASIITLIRREFQNPATGAQGEQVGVMDLMLGLCGMAYLQRWCRRSLEEETRALQIEEVIWDVVVLSDGMRVDVHEESVYGVHDGEFADELSPTSGSGAYDSEEDAEERIKNQIIRSLGDNAKVSITTKINTTKTITVDIQGPIQDMPVSPPPGVELIEESRNKISPQAQVAADHVPHACRVVYRLNRNQERRYSITKEDGDISQVTGYVEQLDDDDTMSERSAPSGDALPPVPTKSQEHMPSSSIPRPGSSASGASSSSKSRIPSLQMPKKRSENAANQKRPRIPPTVSSSNKRQETTASRASGSRFLSSRNRENTDSKRKPVEKKSGFRKFFSRDESDSDGPSRKNKPSQSSGPTRLTKPEPSPKYKSALPSPVRCTAPGCPSASSRPTPRQSSASIPRIEEPGVSPKSSSSSLGRKNAERSSYIRPPSRTSYISVHERRRDSVYSQTESYSISAADDFRHSRPPSPCAIETDDEDAGSLVNPRSSDPTLSHPCGLPSPRNPRLRKPRYTPSIYTLPHESTSSLVPYRDPHNSAFSNTEALRELRQDGLVEGIFPKHHLLRNITRFMRFASASYGSNFLKMLGIAKEMPILRALDTETHHELRSFAHHTESDAGSILLSSFVDPQGGSDGTGSTNTGVPLVHYISLDHDSKAVVLACRGTLGFEDVLADMTCDYDDLVWRDKAYKVHKGIHASAKRLLYGGDGRVLYTLKQALEEFPDYGLVLTGHSLGGGVTALLGVMLSEPAPGCNSTSFVTSTDPHTHLLGDSLFNGFAATQPPRHVCLPSGRPVHVYAYGPPSTMSASLCKATRGLITSIVNGNDMVPYLSLGVLHDFQAVALAFKTDNNEAKVEVRQRIWEAFQTGIADKWYGGNQTSYPGSHDPSSSSSSGGQNGPGSGAGAEFSDDDQWAYAALKVLRASMMSHKLLPPGEVFVVESTRVLRRDAFLLDGEEGHLGRPAQRIVLKYIRDVEQRFREVRFGTSMLTDHSPGKYEDALNKLRAGVMDAA